jgi:hypothetical protein
MNFKQLQENLIKKFADGYVMVWNHRKGRYEFVLKKANEK